MNRLKELRKEKKLTQKELAEKTDIPYRTLQRWENGETDIKSEKANELAKLFNVSVSYLLGYSDKVNAKAKLLDIIISEGYILQSTLDKCISKLDEIDQQEIKKDIMSEREEEN